MASSQCWGQANYQFPIFIEVLRAGPILMTTLPAVLALLPLALGIGAGSQMQQPLAIAVIGGFTVSSLLLFFALPLFYRLFRGRQE